MYLVEWFSLENFSAYKESKNEKKLTELSPQELVVDDEIDVKFVNIWNTMLRLSYISRIRIKKRS